MIKNYSSFLFLFIGFAVSNRGISQNHIGLASGNYAGVSALWFNPSAIVDSRHKFDINLISINSYFDNNLFEVRRDAVLRQRFFKEPYNSSYDAVRADLLRLKTGLSNQPVNMYVDSKIQYPLSMMVSLGKNSAFAINLQSRAGMRVDHLNRSTATLLYNALVDQSQYGMVQDNSGINVNYLRWQEVGLTYGTVLLNRRAHFVKGAFTGKWLMGQSAAHISSDNVQVNFASAQQFSLQSPLIRYYRTSNADVQTLGLNSFFKDIEDHRFGWDVGFTYEFRGRFNRFKYVGENNEVKDRRDLNKYAIRMGVALLDVGKFNFNKKRFTNDHAANINNYNFSQVKANNFDDWDTAYAKLVQYIPNTSGTFKMSLPTAFSANVDVHLFRGFYLNAAMYAPVARITSGAQTNLRAVRWYAVTPRLETRHFGLYIPMVATPLNNRTTVGATVRLGPVYVGSSNFGNYIFNDKLAAIDVHAGVKIGITYGRPSSILKKVSSLLSKKTKEEKDTYRDTASLAAEYRKVIDSIRNMNLNMGNRQDGRAPLVNVIVNNYLSGAPGVMAGDPVRADSVRVNNVIALPGMAAVKNDTAMQRKDAEIDFLLRRIAESEMRLLQLEQRLLADSIAKQKTSQSTRQGPVKKPATGGSSRPVSNPSSKVAIQSKPATSRSAVRNPVVQQPSPIVVRQPAASNPQPMPPVVKTPVTQRVAPAVALTSPAANNQEQLNTRNIRNEQLEKQLRTLRDEMTAAQNAESPAVDIQVDTVTKVLRDTLVWVDTDTVWLHDTVEINSGSAMGAVNISHSQPDYIPVYFATGSSALSPAGTRVLERVVDDFANSTAGYTIHLTGRTDSMGAEELNRQLAQRRINAVAMYLIQHGVPREKIQSETKPLLEVNPRPNAEERRVDIEIISM